MLPLEDDFGTTVELYILPTSLPSQEEEEFGLLLL
jgi:hypothetical protein